MNVGFFLKKNCFYEKQKHYLQPSHRYFTNFLKKLIQNARRKKKSEEMWAYQSNNQGCSSAILTSVKDAAMWVSICLLCRSLSDDWLK